MEAAHPLPRPFDNIRRRRHISSGLVLAAALFLAPFLGLSAAFLPWQFMLVLFGFPMLALFGAAFPLLGVLTVYALIFEAVPDFLQPGLPLGGNKLKLFDLGILYLFAVVMVQAVVRRRPWWQGLRAFRAPLVYLLLAYAVSVTYVKLAAPNLLYLAEARCAVAWLLLPMTFLVAQTPQRQHRLLSGICAITLLISIYLVLQSFLGLRIMTGSRVEALDATANADIVRSIAGGAIYIVLFVLFLAINRVWERRLPLWLALPAMVLLTLALAVQFGRGVWMAGTLGLLVSATYFRGLGGLFKVAVLFLLALVLSSILVAQVNPRAAEALVDRLGSIGQEVDRGGSFAWRKIENQIAIARIIEHPLFGVGVGGDYKGSISASTSFQNEISYIHNAYLYFPLKLGLWAALIPAAFVLAFLLTIRRYGCLAVDARDRGLAAATLGAFTVPVITSFTQPEWVNPRGIAAMCFLMAMALLLAQRAEQRANAARATHG